MGWVSARPKPLVDRTLRRLMDGLRKFAAAPQVMTCNSPGYCQPISQPVGAVTAAGHKALVTPMLLKYYRTGTMVSTDDCAPTVVACQKSYPLSIATAARCAAPHWHATPGDTETMLELKKVMQSLGIGDIYLRMLNEAELARIQGFPAGYILLGTSAHCKKQIGNAVVSYIPEAWLREMYEAQRSNFHCG